MDSVVFFHNWRKVKRDLAECSCARRASEPHILERQLATGYNRSNTPTNSSATKSNGEDIAEFEDHLDA